MKRQDNMATFRYFTEDELVALNNGRESEKLKASGYAGYPVFDHAQQASGGFSTGVLEAFLRRLPPAP
jgi:hypothetical protein